MWSKTSQTEENNKKPKPKKNKKFIFFLTTDGILLSVFLYIIRKQF